MTEQRKVCSKTGRIFRRSGRAFPPPPAFILVDQDDLTQAIVSEPNLAVLALDEPLPPVPFREEAAPSQSSTASCLRLARRLVREAKRFWLQRLQP